MGNMKANRKFIDGEEAVSAVIGVILMVAITVAIAATVYVYVSGLVSGPRETAPTVIFIIKDGSDTASGGTYSADDVVFVLEHSSGEKLKMSDVKIQYKSSAVTTWTTIDATGVANGLKATIPTYFEVGDSIELKAVTTGGTPDGDYSFRIIHVPSQSQILTEKSYTAV